MTSEQGASVVVPVEGPTNEAIQAAMLAATKKVRAEVAHADECAALDKDIARMEAGPIDMGDTGWAIMREVFSALSASPAGSGQVSSDLKGSDTHRATDGAVVGDRLSYAVDNRGWRVILNGRDVAFYSFENDAIELIHNLTATLSAATTDQRGGDFPQENEPDKQPAPAPVGWRPIETYPGGGEHVLLVENGVVFEGRLTDESGWYERNNDPTDHWGEECYPTHWMPLPPAPDTASKAGEGEG